MRRKVVAFAEDETSAFADATGEDAAGFLITLLCGAVLKEHDMRTTHNFHFWAEFVTERSEVHGEAGVETRGTDVVEDSLEMARGIAAEVAADFCFWISICDGFNVPFVTVEKE